MRSREFERQLLEAFGLGDVAVRSLDLHCELDQLPTVTIEVDVLDPDGEGFLTEVRKYELVPR